MKRTPVSSSSIASVGYAPEKSVLEIEFVTGRRYQYSGVPKTLYNRFMRSKSCGRFFNRHIRPRDFPTVEVT